MEIMVLIEPSYRDTYWCRQTMNGIYDETSRKKFTCTVLNEPDPACIDWGRLYGDNKKILIVIGTSISWIPDILKKLTERGVHVVLVSIQPAANFTSVSTILMDHADTLRALYQYLYSLDRSRIALYGINPNSSADRLKTECFRAILQDQDIEDPQDRIYYNFAALADCFDRFQPNINAYDAVICANDVVAVSLIRHLKTCGLRVPDDLYVVSFGDTLLARLFSPSLTTVTLNHDELGRQAVAAVNYLHRNDAIISLSIKVECRIHIRESTNRATPATERILPVKTAPAPPVIFYDDVEVHEALAVESFINKCDELDLQILEGLYTAEKYSDLADQLYTTENSLKYRIRRMLSWLEKDNRDDLVRFLSSFLSRQSIQTARRLKQGTVNGPKIE